MKYFRNLPLVSLINADKTQRVYRNIMARASIIPKLLNDPLVFYSYDIQHTDTPEIIAHKYYGDSYRYWIVLFSNQILDPQWDWPLNDVALDKYITNKYAGTGIDVYTDVHSYQKIITQQNPTTGSNSTETVSISQQEYDTLVPYTKTLSFQSESVIVSVQKRVLNYHDYEIELNESKRNIKLLNKLYVNQLEKEITNLMSK